MLRMGRELGGLSGNVWVYVVAGRRFEPEAEPSPEVSAALDVLTGRIERDIRSWLEGGRPPRCSVLQDPREIRIA